MVTYARANSPYYRDLYRDLQDRIEDPALLPVTDKKTNMAHFDDWVTDRAVTLEKAQEFAADPERVGERFEGKYLLATTSGTSGTRGIFVLDSKSQAVNVALGILRSMSWYSVGDRLRILARGGRQAFVMATGGHFVGIAGAAQLQKESWLMRKTSRVFPVHKPLPELVGALNEYRPAIMLGYASVVSMLAGEQEAGRLRIHPVLVQPAGEYVKEADLKRIAEAFDAKVRTAYAATECPFIASSCAYHWLHVESDWVIIEPVDADYRPTPPGSPSHTVLVSNLANRAQPILRYDLGDSVLMKPDPCPCGNPLPAIRVQGRAGDVLTFPADHGEVTIAPLAFSTLFDRTPGIEMFQIVQTSPTSLQVRLRLVPDTEPASVWQAVRAALTNLLYEHGVGHVTVEHADVQPESSPGGKYRTVIPLEQT